MLRLMLCVTLCGWFQLGIACEDSACKRPEKSTATRFSDEEMKKYVEDIIQKSSEHLSSQEAAALKPQTDQHDSGLKIFVSLSIPKKILEQLITEAKSRFGQDVIFIFRGMKKAESMGESIKHLEPFAEVNTSIDPDSFAEYAIDQVPTFVVGSPQKHDKISGLMTIQYALDYLAEHGEYSANVVRNIYKRVNR